MSTTAINGKTCWSSRAVAYFLNIGRNTMLARLRDRGIFNSSNLPKSNYWDIFEVKDSIKWNTKTAYWTQRAIDLTKEVCSDIPRKKSKVYKQELTDYGDLIEII